MIASHRNKKMTIFSSFVVSMDLVKFENVKTKYYINEDITLEYILDAEIHSSSRNWVGLFARGCSNLQQYIAFEWTIISPRDELSPRQTIEFLSKYFASNIDFNQQYQFLYISRKMEVLGGSQYFRFLPAKEFAPTTQNVRFTEQPVADQPCASSVALSPTQHHQALQQKQLLLERQSSPEGRSLGRDCVSEDTFCSLNGKSHSNSRQLCCPQCKQAMGLTRIHENLLVQIKSSAEHVRALEMRMKELERDLEMSQVARKVLKLVAHHAKREKMAYQKFLNDMMLSLSEKGTARIIYGQGTEMLLKRVTSDNTLEYSETKPSAQEPLLKAIIGSQEKTIQDLQAQLDCTRKVIGGLSSLRIGTSAVIDLDSYSNPKIVDIKRMENYSKPVLDEVNNEDCENEVLNTTYSIEQPSSMRVKQQQMLQELGQVFRMKQLEDNDEQCKEDLVDEGERKDEPTAVIIRGDHAQFAIIRF